MNDQSRHVPLITRVALFVSDAGSQFGWLFIGFGMLFVWAFTVPAFKKYNDFRGVTRVHDAEVMGAEMNKHEGKIMGYMYDYRYKSSKGEPFYEGRGYKLGLEQPVGSTVEIEFVVNDPSISRLKGAEDLPLFMAAIPLFFPLSGFCLLLFGLKRGYRAGLTLNRGVLTEAELVSKKATNTRVNKMTVYEYIFEYSDIYGAVFTTSDKTHLRDEIESHQHYKVCYLPEKPAFATVLESLPEGTIEHVRGDFIVKTTRSCFLNLISPAITIVVHGFIMFKVLF